MNAAVVFRVSEPFLGYPAWYISGIGMGVLANSSKTFSMKFSPGNRDGQTAMAMSLAANLGIGVAVTVGGTLKNFFGSQSDALAISMVAILAVSTTLVFAGWTISFVTNAAHLGNVNRD